MRPAQGLLQQHGGTRIRAARARYRETVQGLLRRRRRARLLATPGAAVDASPLGPNRRAPSVHRAACPLRSGTGRTYPVPLGRRGAHAVPWPPRRRDNPHGGRPHAGRAGAVVGVAPASRRPRLVPPAPETVRAVRPPSACDPGPARAVGVSRCAAASGGSRPALATATGQSSRRASLTHSSRGQLWASPCGSRPWGSWLPTTAPAHPPDGPSPHASRGRCRRHAGAPRRLGSGNRSSRGVGRPAAGRGGRPRRAGLVGADCRLLRLAALTRRQVRDILGEGFYRSEVSFTTCPETPEADGLAAASDGHQRATTGRRWERCPGPGLFTPLAALFLTPTAMRSPVASRTPDPCVSFASPSRHPRPPSRAEKMCHVKHQGMCRAVVGRPRRLRPSNVPPAGWRAANGAGSWTNWALWRSTSGWPARARLGAPTTRHVPHVDAAPHRCHLGDAVPTQRPASSADRRHLRRDRHRQPATGSGASHRNQPAREHARAPRRRMLPSAPLHGHRPGTSSSFGARRVSASQSSVGTNIRPRAPAGQSSDTPLTSASTRTIEESVYGEPPWAGASEPPERDRKKGPASEDARRARERPNRPPPRTARTGHSTRWLR